MLTKEITRFREALAVGPVFGPFSKTCDPALVEVMGHAGFDFVILDQEHGPVGTETLGNLVRAAHCVGLLPIVRVPDLREEAIAKALDAGAAGVQVPQVASPEQVRQVLRAARFAPQGQRGVCRFVRAADYSALPREQYFQQANDALVVIQLEGKEALGNLEAILSVGGFDIVFIGPYDLSQSLGLTGQIEHPSVVQSMRQVVERCQEKGVIVGTFVESAEAAKRWIGAGVRYVSYSVDVGIFYQAAKTILNRIKDEGRGI